MTPALHHEVLRPEEGRATRWTWFLHGIFGAGRNWRSLARRLIRRLPGWGAVLLDLRLHGASSAAEPPHTLEACAGDLAETAAGGAPRPEVVVGHSFGGKVALMHARRRPEGLGQVWVVDSTPSRREPAGRAVRMLETLRARSGPFGDREEAVAALGEEGFPPPVGRWMATNLVEREDGLRWRFDLEEVGELLDDFFRRDLWDVVEAPPEGLEVAFVKAEGSEVLPEPECRRVEAAGSDTGRVWLERLPGGHWLNVTNPDGLLELMEERLPR